MKPITDAAIKAAIRRAKSDGKPVTIKDPGPRGGGRLALQIRPGSRGPTAEWYAIYYRQGRRIQTKLGAYPQTTLAAAREEFGRDLVPAIASGEDPGAARREARRQRIEAGSVKALFAAYVAHMKARGRRSWDEYEGALLTRKGAAATVLGADRPASAITPSDIASLLGKVYQRGARSYADHLRAYMHAAFAWGLQADNDYRQRSGSEIRWGLSANPVAAVPRDPAASKPGDRHLSPDELRDFWAWLDGQSSHSARVLQLVIATGQRVQMLTRIGPSHFDAKLRLLTWGADETKNGTPHVLPLPGKAVTIIKGLPVTKASPLYFPQPRAPEKPVTHFTVADLCRDYCGRDEYDGEPFTPRDLRRTWKTLAGLAGISKEMRDRLQHHAMRDVGSKHYDRYDYLPEKRAAMKVWSAWLDRELAKKRRGNVALLRNAGA